MRSVIIEETKCEFKAVYLWTVSKIVINYLKNETTNFGVFITHRINEIRNNSKVNEWHYVSTKDNIADNLMRYRDLIVYRKHPDGVTVQISYIIA